MTTHYDVLGVSPKASSDQIKRAYYRRARAYHPDSHVGSSVAVLDEAQEAMAAVNAAWNVLRDPRLRSEYDGALSAAKMAARQRRGRVRGPHPRLEIGNGFRYWMATSGVPGPAGRTRISLAVDGATDLSPLRALAPTGLYALHAAGAAIDDAQLVHLTGMTGLQELDLTDTGVTDAGLLHLQGLDRLEHLALWDTHVTDEGLALLGRITSLRTLGLGNTRVTDAGMAGLASLSHLRVLQLWGTDVAGPGLDHLHGLRHVEIVTLPWRVRGRARRRLRSALPRALVV
ncbi:MAG: hypothetical protein QOE35_3597 [Actinomycetota bacterium]